MSATAETHQQKVRSSEGMKTSTASPLSPRVTGEGRGSSVFRRINLPTVSLEPSEWGRGGTQWLMPGILSSPALTGLLLSGPMERKGSKNCYDLGGRFANLLACVVLDLSCSSLFSKVSFLSSSVLFS